ncbi:cupin domain-containing protein [Halorubrum sp. PV6]|uniref:cupin domain-containing protein n=1 Tax=Halorubrum sp. PV6 TaxID=634157 RepID=UPI000F852DB7|nr:cupin domain-containing protein [Halorubrum sp. PV6]AZQ15695.1 cupin domain-containing protein [Halorubrum sp. PV6]
MRDTTDDAAAPTPVVRRGDDVDYAAVEAAAGLTKGVLLDESDGAPNFAMRRFELAAGAEVPRHTNAVEHEQYVLAGEYVVGIGETEHVVEPGDALLIPAGVEHWYRNEGDEAGAFICAVPNGDDDIELVE